MAKYIYDEDTLRAEYPEHLDKILDSIPRAGYELYDFQFQECKLTDEGTIIVEYISLSDQSIIARLEDDTFNIIKQ